MKLQSIVDYLDYTPNFDNDPQNLVDAIIAQASSYLGDGVQEAIQHAYVFAREAHAGQLRESGEAYVIHVVKATEYLMHMMPDLVTIQTCLLHDVIEDTPVTYEDVLAEFGESVAQLCDSLVKVSKVQYYGEERQIETLKKTFLAMASDLRVIFVKVADRVHNVQTLSYLKRKDKQRRVALETMKIFVPLCKRLGLYHYQLYLENGAFAILHPQECQEIVDYMCKHFGADQKYIEKGIKKLSVLFHKEKMPYASVKGRLKSPYRIFQKMEEKYHTADPSKVLDMVAFRVVTETVHDCYNILGVMHKYYTPMIHKIKDYISLPKNNGYSSLHTTVMGMFHFPVEIQIRTRGMDAIAEYGVAAHYAYSDGKAVPVDDYQAEWIAKLQAVVTAYTTEGDKEQFKDALRLEVLSKTKFLYTPKGDVIELPVDATVLDFAFRIHSSIGLKFKSASVNGAIKPISYVPDTGDVVEIKKFKNKIAATHYWYDFLHTSSAKNKLAKHLKEQEKDHLLVVATEKLNAKLKEWSLPALDSSADKIRASYDKDDLDRLLLLMLDKQLPYTDIFRNVYPQEWKAFVAPRKKRKPVVKDKPAVSVLVDVDKQVDYSLCSLCDPVEGNPIVARSGKDGIKIHKTSCRGLKTVAVSRLLEAHWVGADPAHYAFCIELTLQDSSKGLLELIAVFAAMQVVIDVIHVSNQTGGTSDVSLKVIHTNPGKMDFLLKDLKKRNDTVTVKKLALCDSVGCDS